MTQAIQRVDLGFRARQWQARCYRLMRRFSVIVVHRRGGKTVLSVMRLIDQAIRIQRPKARYAYIAPELKQAKAVAWDYLKHYALKIPGATHNESELWVELPNGARIRIYGADNPDSLRGLYFDGVVLDEVAQMRPTLWGEVIRPTLGDREGWALFIGTPKGINLFSELFFRALDDPSWYAELFTPEHTQALSDTELQAMRREMSDAQWRQEMLCDFTASSDESLISLDLVQKSLGKHLIASEYAHAPVVLGVDVARQGADRTVIQPRQGLAGFMPTVLQGADNMAVVSAVARIMHDRKPQAVFVDGSGGYGAGVIDRLRQLGHTIIEVQFGGAPQDVRYANKRAEMWWRMREWLEQGGALPNLPEYRIDLTSPLYDFANARNKLALESKESMAERGLRSPDFGDALALTFAEFVAAPRMIEHASLYAVSGKCKTDYNPWDRA